MRGGELYWMLVILQLSASWRIKKLKWLSATLWEWTQQTPIASNQTQCSDCSSIPFYLFFCPYAPHIYIVLDLIRFFHAGQTVIKKKKIQIQPGPVFYVDRNRISMWCVHSVNIHPHTSDLCAMTSPVCAMHMWERVHGRLIDIARQSADTSFLTRSNVVASSLLEVSIE